MAQLLIAGCGYVGAALAAQLAADGHRVLGLRRNPRGLPAPVVPVAADLTDRAALARALDAVGGPLDALVYAAAPGAAADDAYRAAYVDGLRHALEVVAERGERLRRVLFTSSTSVYAQSAGEWVDEESATEPRGFRGARVLEAERMLFASGVPATALRLGGIYGPGRTRLVERVRSGRAPARPGCYTNRIHRDDAAGALRHLLGLALAGERVAPIYLGVDDDPADEATVARWLAERLAVPPPGASEASRSSGVSLQASEASAQRGEAERSSSGLASAQQSNKRCRNARLRATGYRFRYPTFREGYAALLTSPGS